ncbi:hypothetical protein EYF80_035663 [Liparis tanakae]|uniref:Uncharacterized protein n=1 Tax=Liparis tanakae TaxID=230148 RepID=A0A4Z2GMT8_9TELE|nr:hypothetical protein EYF80_035663 [Liparis tanakae]
MADRQYRHVDPVNQPIRRDSRFFVVVIRSVSGEQQEPAPCSALYVWTLVSGDRTSSHLGPLRTTG